MNLPARSASEPPSSPDFSPSKESVIAGPSDYRLEGTSLHHGDRLVLKAMARRGWTLQNDPTGTGTFLIIESAAPITKVALGQINALSRFTSSARHNPFWVLPWVGTIEADAKPATLWLLAETGRGDFVLLVPLLGQRAAFSLQGSPDGLVLKGQTGDATVPVGQEIALFLASGADPFELLRASARAVRRARGDAITTNEPPPPDFADLFGWCTWDAFYQDVSPEKIRAGLQSFAAAGVRPRVLVLDDGWQTVGTTPTGEQVLTDLRPNHRFNHDLTSLVKEVKHTFGISHFIVWHALTGYWGGVCAKSLPTYAVRSMARKFDPELLANDATGEFEKWGDYVGVPGADQVQRFFDDYHDSLRRQGVDGVKVDNQAVLEAVSDGQGGRVHFARAYRTALDHSVARHFGGQLLNCMSCSPEGLYLGTRSLMRTSDDFWPQRAESHGLHIYANAHACLWLGEFVCADWDMFQSGHPYGAFHAAARVVSGGPIYVSDAPGRHDAALLRKLMLHDGTVLRADGPGRVTRDGLFVDPIHSPSLLKIFNTAGDCGLVGVFNPLRPDQNSPATKLNGTVSAADVEGLGGEHFIGFHASDGRLRSCARADHHALSLAGGGWELITFAPVIDGLAVIGLADKLNSAGVVVERRELTDSNTEITLRDGGEFLAWTHRQPASLSCNGTVMPFRHDHDGALRATLPVQGDCRVRITW